MLVGPRSKVVGEPSHPILVATTLPINQIVSKVVYALFPPLMPLPALWTSVYTLVSLTPNEMLLSSP